MYDPQTKRIFNVIKSGSTKTNESEAAKIKYQNNVDRNSP